MYWYFPGRDLWQRAIGRVKLYVFLENIRRWNQLVSQPRGYVAYLRSSGKYFSDDLLSQDCKLLLRIGKLLHFRRGLFHHGRDDHHRIYHRVLQRRRNIWYIRKLQRSYLAKMPYRMFPDG